MIIKDINIGQGIPKICVPLVGKNQEELLSEIDALKGCYYDMIEWRIDYYQEDVVEGIKSIPGDKPLLVTCRTSYEGGNANIDKESYMKQYKTLMDTGLVDLIDVEHELGVCDELVDYAHSKHVYVIASNHDFHKTYEVERMLDLFKSMDESGADILKIALMPNCELDVLKVLEATTKYKQQTTKPLITMSMSKLGFVSRTVGESFGSAVTFGSLKEASAPGQISANKLHELLTLMHEGL